MRCISCNKIIPDDSNYCIFCGGNQLKSKNTIKKENVDFESIPIKNEILDKLEYEININKQQSDRIKEILKLYKSEIAYLKEKNTELQTEIEKQQFDMQEVA